MDRFIASLLLVIGLLCESSVLAHPGRTDSSGGHHDRKNGGYHHHNSGRSSGGGGGGGSSPYSTPSFTPTIRGYKYTPRPKRRASPKPTKPEPYWKRNSLVLHTFHSNRGKTLVRGEAKAVEGDQVIITKMNGDKFRTPSLTLASVDYAFVLASIKEGNTKGPFSGWGDINDFSEQPNNIVDEEVPGEDWSKGYRTWHARNGKYSTIAKVVDLSPTKVLLRKKTQGVSVVVTRIELLCDEDQQYIDELRLAIGSGEPTESTPGSVTRVAPTVVRSSHSHR